VRLWSLFAHANEVWERTGGFSDIEDVINMTIVHSISTCQMERRGHSIKHVIRFTSSSFVLF
jgi:hypothetical protein